MRKYWVILALMPLFFSCGSRDVYNQFVTMSDNAWHSDSLARFTFNIEDNTVNYNILINIRHTDKNPWQNLWLFINKTSPDNIILKDTLMIMIADDFGKWLGAGSSSVFNKPIVYKANYRFERTGTYHYSIVHGMRDTTLTGIRNVGLRVEKIK